MTGATLAWSGPDEHREEDEPGAPLVALGILVASALLAAGSLVCFALVRPEWTSDLLFFVVDATDAVVYGVVAWAVLGRRRHAVGWVLAVTAVGCGLAGLSSTWSLLAREDPGLWTPVLLESAQNWAWIPGTLALVVVVPWLVRDDPLPPHARVAVVAGSVVTALVVVARWTDASPRPPEAPPSLLPVEGGGWASFLDVVFEWQWEVVVVLGALAAVDVARRWRRGPTARRRGLGWLAIGTALIAASFVPLALPEVWDNSIPFEVTPLVHLLSQAFFPAAVLVAVLGQRLWGIDLVVNRTLTWWLMTGGLIAVYVVVVALFSRLLPGTEGTPRVLATALVAAGFSPARSWVQRRVDGLVLGNPGALNRVARRVGQGLVSEAGLDDLLGEVADGLVESLRLAGVRIDVVEGPGRQAGRVESGDPGAFGGPDTRGRELTYRADLVFRGERVGRLVAAGRPGERLDGRTTDALDELVPVLGATVALEATTQALSASRLRLAEARDEERRTLRRELHDGLGPALAGVGLGVQAARNLLGVDDDRARELLDRLVAEIDRRVEEVRDLARGLLPPVLGELGLVPAFHELRERYAVAGLDVVVDAPPVALADQVAGGVYGIVAEAVRNVHRHANAQRCTIRVEVRDATLVVEVEDDGIGMAADRRAGIGLQSMRERAEGVGGRLEVGPRPGGGTVVRATVAMGPGRDDGGAATVGAPREASA